MIVVLTGAAGALGDRVIDGLRAHSNNGLRAHPSGGRRAHSDGNVIDVVVQQPGVPVGGSIGRCDVVVDLGSSDYDRRAARRESVTEFVAETLGTADRLRASQVVFVSSAMVYGALANNPVPLTEEAALRPDVEFVFARQLASAEELVEQWRQSGPRRASCVLRPAVSLAAGGDSRLATAIVSGFGRRLAEADPPSQYLHLDDLAAAVVRAVTDQLDGVYNVAPDGWVAGERVRALSGERPRLPLPERFSELAAGLRWRFQRGPIPPGLLSYTLEPWVVSNGRLRAAGWVPRVTNEQAYVESTEAPWWTMVSPKRRQELTLGAGVAGASLVALVVAAVVRHRISRRRV
jgi:nucleoside-diphosphate-sugar epimerase